MIGEVKEEHKLFSLLYNPCTSSYRVGKDRKSLSSVFDDDDDDDDAIKSWRNDSINIVLTGNVKSSLNGYSVIKTSKPYCIFCLSIVTWTGTN